MLTDQAPYRLAIAEYIRAAARPPDKFAHQPRLYQVARSLGEGHVYDDDVLHAAVWLHDVGVFVGHRPEDPEALALWDNVAYAVRVVPDLLLGFGFPPSKIPVVAETIRTHLPSGEPTAIEGVLLRDADILEQLGAVGILRMVSKVGRDTRYPTHSEAVSALRRSASDLPGRLILPLAREMAKARLAFMAAFFEATVAELLGGEECASAPSRASRFV